MTSEVRLPLLYATALNPVVAAIVIADLYSVPFSSEGVVPSVVYLIFAPDVAHDRVTVWDASYVPPATDATGFSAPHAPVL